MFVDREDGVGGRATPVRPAAKAGHGYGRFMQADPLGYDDGLNMYDYVGGDSLNYKDPSGEKRFYVGGALDATTEIVKEVYERDASRGIDASYYQWFEGIRLLNDVGAASKSGIPIDIISHSLGASQSIWVSAHTNATINSLITIDPVGNPGIERGGLQNVRHWLNVTADPRRLDLSDHIASLGVKTSAIITAGANASISTAFHHGQFQRMLSQALTSGKGSFTYSYTPTGSLIARKVSVSVGIGGDERPGKPDAGKVKKK